MYWPPFMSQVTHLWATLQEKRTGKSITVDLMKVQFVTEDADGGSTLYLPYGREIEVEHSRARIVELLTKGTSAP